MAPNDGSKVFSAFSLAAAIGAAALARKGLATTWRATTGKNPPANPADPDVRLGEAVAWAVVSGTMVGLARMLASRKAASYYAKSTGRLPAQLKRDGQHADAAAPATP